MRGIVPAYILGRMDEELKRTTDRPLYSFFDLIAGTSTGALIALGLTSPAEGTALGREDGENWRVERSYTTGRIFRKEHRETAGFIEKLAPPGEFVNLYRNNGNQIFMQKETRGLRRIMDRVNRFFSDKYEIEPYEAFLERLYGDTPLSESRIPTMAVSFNAATGHEYVFRSWDSHGFLLREAARASSAAPTYFAPAKFIDRTSESALLLLDGGIIANNPVLSAFIEARRLYPEADEFRFLSLSTASASFRMDPDGFSSNLDWMGPLLRAYSTANMNISLEAVKAVKGVSVLRVWDDVLERHLSLDDTSENAVNTLLEAGREIWKKQEAEILEYMKELTEGGRIPPALLLSGKENQDRSDERKEASLSLPSL